MTLRSKLIRLAHAKPELRPDILPLLKKASGAAQVAGLVAYEKNINEQRSKALSRKLSELKDEIADLSDSLDKLSDNETVWKIWGNTPEGKEFEAVLTVYGSGHYELSVPYQHGVSRGYDLVGLTTNVSELTDKLRDYTDLNWDLQQADRERWRKLG